MVSILTDAGYYLLIPGLPGHGDSVHIHPFEVEDIARLLVLLIETEAREGAAHVASSALAPMLLPVLLRNTLCECGPWWHPAFNLFTPNIRTPFMPPLVYLVQRGSGLVQSPDAEWRQLCDGQVSLAVTRSILNTLHRGI